MKKYSSIQEVTSIFKELGYEIKEINNSLFLINPDNQLRISISFKNGDINQQDLDCMNNEMNKSDCLRGIIVCSDSNYCSFLYNEALSREVKIINLEDLINLPKIKNSFSL